MRATPIFLTAVIGLALGGCQRDVGLDGDGTGSGVPQNCRYIGDPDDPNGVKRVCEDAWTCDNLPNAAKKCTAKRYGRPSGGSGWTCTHDGEHLTCTKKESGAVGGSGWDCKKTEFGEECTGSAGGGGSGSGSGGGSGSGNGSGVIPGPGGGTWKCKSYTDANKTVCESESAGDTPPGGTDWNCTVNGEFITCKSSGSGGSSTTGDGGTSTKSDGGGTSTGSGTPTIGGGLPGGGTPCFCPSSSSKSGLPGNEPLAIIKTTKTTVKGVPVLRARIIYSKKFCDNSYGVNSIGWGGAQGKGRQHAFNDLVKSDHQVLYWHNCAGQNVITTQLDYIEKDSTSPSGWGSLGVNGGDGKMLKGKASDVVAWTSSLDENFNTYKHVLTVDSPAADTSYKVKDPKYKDWMFEMWYQADVKWSAFGSSGPCKVTMLSLHASPSKTGDDTVSLSPCTCK